MVVVVALLLLIFFSHATTGGREPGGRTGRSIHLFREPLPPLQGVPNIPDVRLGMHTDNLP